MNVKKLLEVRLNTHQTHLESLPTLGKNGLDELNSYIDKFIKQLNGNKELTLMSKIDGAPSVIMWHNIGNGYPNNSIALKSFVNGPKTALSTNEQIDERYGDRPDMAEKLKQCLALAKYIPNGEAWQGDCLFTKNDLKEEEINGTEYVTFHPNKIVYAFSEDNPGYSEIKNADLGIAFHTIYTINNGKISQSFDVDNSKINSPDNFYLLFHEMTTTGKEKDFNVDQLKKDFSELKQLEQNLISDNNYEDLVRNKLFIDYWNTFENKEFADNKKIHIDTNTILKDLKEYILNKKENEHNKKISTLKTDKGIDRENQKYNNELIELENLFNTNKDTIINLVKVINKAADIKMDLWRSLNKSKDDFSTFYKSKTKGYIPANREGISMSDKDGNLVKIVDRSEFSSNNRNDDFISGFEHESLQEDIDVDKLDIEIKPILKKALGNNERSFIKHVIDLVLNDKYLNYFSHGDKKVSDYWLNNFNLDTSQRGISSAINSALVEISDAISDTTDYKDTLNWDDRDKLPEEEKFKIDLYYDWDVNIRKNFWNEYDEDDPIRDLSFKEYLKYLYKHNKNNYNEKELKWLSNAIKEYDMNNKNEKFYSKENFSVATQGVDMGSFKSFTKNLNENTAKKAVVAFGRFNPPTIGHRKLAEEIAKKAKDIGGEALMFISHSSNDIKNPLSYESKMRWCEKAFGDIVKVIDTDAKTAQQILTELYKNGYTDIVYAGGGERIGGDEDMFAGIKYYNSHPTKSGEQLYKFTSLDPLDTGTREIPYEGAQNASATHVRKLAAEKNFDEFKKYVPFNENDAKNLFNELRYALKDFTNIVEKYLKEAGQLTKKRLMNDPELVKDLENELNKIDRRLDVPDLEKGLDDYKSDPSGYQGLFVKQDQTGKVSFSRKDVANYASNELNKKGDIVVQKIDDITVEDEKGNEYELYDSSSSVQNAKGGVAWEDKNEKTYYQECIQLLLLTNSIRYSGDLIEWLKNSNRKKRTNIFEYVEPYRQTKVRDEKLFNQYWNGFIDSYSKAFKLCQDRSNEFTSDINSLLKTSGKLIPIHGGIIAPWSDKAEVILAGQDTVDKSDGYVVSNKDKSKIDKILSTMIKLKKDPVEYVKFMEKAPIIGISLKKNNGKEISFDYDEQPIAPNEVKKIYFTTSNSGNQIIFNLEGKETSLDIRSAGGVKVEFRPKGEPAYGNAVTALKRTLGDRYEKFGALLKARRFRDATRYLISLLCNEKSPKENTYYTFTKQGMKDFAEIFNFAAGRPSYNDNGERLTAPYMKVH